MAAQSFSSQVNNSLFFIFQGIFLIGKDILRITEVMFDFVWKSNKTLQKLKTCWEIVWWWFLNKQQQNFGYCRGTVTSQVLLIWEEQQLQPLLGLGLGEAASVSKPFDLSLLGSGHLRESSNDLATLRPYCGAQDFIRFNHFYLSKH